MKIRDGFVSNSSSSSFVVTVRDDLEVIMAKAKGEKYERPLSKAQVAKLKEYGFKLSASIMASQIEAGVKPTKGRNVLWYSVMCNQDDVIEFLVRERIPFVASCHYGHESVFYDGKSNEYTQVRNLGLVTEMYGNLIKHGLGFGNDKCVEHRKVDEYEDS